MTARSVATAVIAFHPLTIPVRIYATTKGLKNKVSEGRCVSLHARDHGRLIQKSVCTTCNEIVERHDSVRVTEHVALLRDLTASHVRTRRHLVEAPERTGFGRS
jgi:non-homologous end joining protein Ku